MTMAIEHIPRRNGLIETLDPERQQLHATYRAVGNICRRRT